MPENQNAWDVIRCIEDDEAFMQVVERELKKCGQTILEVKEPTVKLSKQEAKDMLYQAIHADDSTKASHLLNTEGVFLLEENIINTWQMSALIMACKLNKSLCCRVFLQAKFKKQVRNWNRLVNRKDSTGMHALAYCCKAGNAECAFHLLRNGALAVLNKRVDTPVGSLTPIEYCAAQGHANVAALLIVAGANPYATCVQFPYEGKDTLFIAKYEGHKEKFEALMKKRGRLKALMEHSVAATWITRFGKSRIGKVPRKKKILTAGVDLLVKRAMEK